MCVCVARRHIQWQRLGECQNSFKNVKLAFSKQTTNTHTHTRSRRMCRPAVDMQIVHTHIAHTLKLVEICCVSNTLSKCKVRLHRILTIRRLNASRSMQQPLSGVECVVCVRQTKEFLTFIWLMCTLECARCVCVCECVLVYLLRSWLFMYWQHMDRWKMSMSRRTMRSTWSYLGLMLWQKPQLEYIVVYGEKAQLFLGYLTKRKPQK